MTIQPKGNPNSKIWMVIDKPYDKDTNFVFDSGLGFVYNKLWRESGIQTEPYICSISNNLSNILTNIHVYRPPIICPLGKIATALFCPETRSRSKDANKNVASLEKYAGSLLVSSSISYPHYIIPLLSPDAIVSNWEYKFVHIQIDLGHVREESDYYRKHNCLQPLPKRTILTEPEYPLLIDTLRGFESSKLLSTDIETLRPRKGSIYYGRMPGHLYLMGIANSPSFAISFAIWNYTPEQTVNIFRQLNYLFKRVPQVGQNYFTFDTHFTEAYGLEHCLEQCEDTMLRHQILWPELPHKLQFLTKQYTRQPYYKDEGRGWSPKYLKKYMIYNGLDCCVTYEVYEGQEEEFNDRPYLK